MKQIILIVAAVLMAVSAYAQFPNTTNKLRLGIQTTGDGLIYRHAGTPSWTPTTINNAWQSIDTLTGDLYTYRGGTWFLEVKGDLQQVYPVVINKSGVNIKRGEIVSVDTSAIIQGDQIRIMRAIGDGGLSSKLIMGVAATDINNDAQGYVVWFGYVREVVQANIAETGVTLNAGDILYLSATEPGRLTNVEPTPPALKTTIALVVRKPNANNMTLLVRPKLNEDLRDLNDVDLNGINDGQTIVWDSINTKWIAGDVGSAIDTTTIATKFYVDSKVDSTRLVSDSILVYYIGGVELRRDTLSLPPAGVTSITAGVGLTGGTITTTGTIAADTAGVLVTKTFLTNQGYTTNTGTITGSGTTNTVAKFTGTTAIGNSLITDDGTNVAVSGTASLRIPSGTTAQRPGTPSVGMMRNNTSNNNLDFYTGTAWENPLKSATTTGLGTAGRVFYADANGRATDTTTLTYGSNTLNSTFTNTTVGKGSYCLNPIVTSSLSSGTYTQIALPIALTAGGTSSDFYLVTFDVIFTQLILNSSINKITVSVFGTRAPTVLTSGNKSYVVAENAGVGSATYHIGHDGTRAIVWLSGFGSASSFIINNVKVFGSTNPVDFCSGWAITSTNTLGTVATTARVGSFSNTFDKDAGSNFLSNMGLKFGVFSAGTGAKQLTIPTTGMSGDNMFHFKGTVTNGLTGQPSEFEVVARINFTTLVWSSVSVRFPYGNPSSSQLGMWRFGNDGTNLKIWVGDTTSTWGNHFVLKITDAYSNGLTNDRGTFTNFFTTSNWSLLTVTSIVGTVNATIQPVRSGAISYATTGISAYSNNFTYNPTTNRLAVGDTTSVRTLTVTGEARISDLTTDTPTRIVGADADGDLGAITVGSGLTLSAGTLTAAAQAGTTNLTFSGASSPVTLNSDTGTDVTFTAGTNVTFSQSANNLTINATASAATRQIASFTSSGGQVVLSQFDNEIADNDLTGTHSGYASSDFVADSSYVRYTGTDTIYVRLTAQISFLSNAVSNLIIGIGVDPGFNTITETAVYFRTATSGQHSLPVLSHIYQCVPNTKFYLNVENTTNNTITLDTFYNIQVEKIN